MELLFIFVNSYIVGFSGAMMPGPLLVVGLSETPRHGWKTGPIISTGHAIAEIFVVIILSMGLIAVSENSVVTAWIGLIGGVSLIIMGIMMGYDIITARVTYEPSSSKQSNQLLALKGITATLSNPYWFVWWATTGLAFLVKSLKFGVAGPVVFYFGHILSDYTWYTFVSVSLWSGKKLMVGNTLRNLILLCAIFLIYLGVTFIIDGATSLS